MTWNGSTTRENLFSPVTGFADGILTALTFAAGHLLRGAGGSVSLGLRVATAAAASGAFVSFAAHYARLSSELVRAERQLNLMSRGRLVTTHLGTAVRREAGQAALVSSTCAFLGAGVPMLVGAVVPAPGWLPVAAGILALGALGAGIGYATASSQTSWSVGLAGAGLILAGLGVVLHVT